MYAGNFWFRIFLTFIPVQLVLVTTINLLVYELPTSVADGPSKKASGKQKKAVEAASLKLVQTVDRPTLPGKNAGSSFRAAKFHPQKPEILYTVINTVPPRTRTKNSPRSSFVCKWDTTKWAVIKIRQVSDRGLTCFDVR
jgi:prolactin regulatory element-binding protein